MSTSTHAASSDKLERTTASPCVDRECTSGRRNRYYVGKRLTADTFRVEQDYLVERRRLINRAMHGIGVVYGYAVAPYTPDPSCADARSGLLAVGAGLALDPCGRELVQIETLPLTLRDVTVLDENSKPDKDLIARVMTGTPAIEICWLLSVHYAEEAIGPVHLDDPCGCERHQWDQVCETVRYSLRQIDCAQCCADHGCGLDCRCASGRCCSPPSHEPEQGYKADAAHGDDAARDAWERSHKAPRGGCRCLCEHVTHLPVGADCHPLCRAGSCDCDRAGERLRVAWHDGVPLACVTLRKDECDEWAFAEIVDDCGPRSLVKRNELLFDLIRGCDLTHIAAIGWAGWHRASARMPWNTFVEYFGGAASQGPCSTRFWVVFSRPVRRLTVRPDCFAMTIIFREAEGAWTTVLRVPIVGVDDSDLPGIDPGDDQHPYAKARRQPGDPPQSLRRARIVVSAAWIKDAVLGAATRFDRTKSAVEIEIRGDYILDCNGQPVDANAHGLVPAPTGNGTPGGTFLSAFRVDAKPTTATTTLQPTDDE